MEFRRVRFRSVEVVPSGKSGSGAADVLAFSEFFEAQALMVGAPHMHRHAHNDAALLATFERPSGSPFCHPSPPTATVSPKKASTRSKTSVGVCAECTCRRKSLPLRTP